MTKVHNHSNQTEGARLLAMAQSTYKFNITMTEDGNKVTLIVPERYIELVRTFVAGVTQLRMFKITPDDVVVKGDTE